MRAIPFTLIRGGTSKGVFLSADDVPSNREELSALLLRLFGSPDPRQIDGLGGADKLTSKAAVLGPPIRQDSDITYLFAQVGIATSSVEYSINCGNLTAGVADYAVRHGFVEARDGEVAVRIHNLNTDRLITAHIQVAQGEPVATGDTRIAGVPGTAAPIRLDFAEATGAATGELLPLGGPVTVLPVPFGAGQVEVSVVDCANLVVFVAAHDLGVDANASPQAIDCDEELLERIRIIRRAVALRLGLAAAFDSTPVPASPILVMVGAPAGYRTFGTGISVKPEQMDVCVRLYANGSTSRAYAGTVSACTGVAAQLEGTLVARHLGNTALPERVRIGHPGGVLEVAAAVTTSPDGPVVRRAELVRTARPLASGYAFLA